MLASSGHPGWRLRSVLLTAGLFFLGATFPTCPADTVTVTVTKRVPVECLSADGSVIGVREATVGAHYTLIKAAAGQVTMQDSAGRYQIAIVATDYVPPAALVNQTAATPTPTPSAASTNVVARVVSPPAPATNAPSAATASASATSSPGGALLPYRRIRSTPPTPASGSRSLEPCRSGRSRRW